MLGAIGLLGAISFGGYIQPNLNDDVRSEFLFAAVSVAAVIPVLMLLGLWGKAVKEGKPKGQAPLLFGLCTGLLFLGGAAAGVLVPFSKLGLQGSQYELGQLNLVLLAGLLAALGGLVFWGPKLWGRSLPDRPAGGLAVLGLMGVGLIAVPDIILGFLDWPLGQVDFSLDQENLGKFLNAVSFIGYVLLLHRPPRLRPPGGALLRQEGRARRRRPVGRPDPRVGHVVAPAGRRGLRPVGR